MPNEIIKPKVVEKNETKQRYIVNPEQGDPNKMCKWIEEQEKNGYEFVDWKCVVTIGSMGIRHIALMKKKGR